MSSALMTIRVRLFAILKDRARVAETTVSVPLGAAVADAVDAVAAQFPAIAALLASTATAVNREYVQRDHVLRPGDELALIPPVSGG